TVFMALLKPGDTFLGMDLSNGGHLTHGSPVNFSGILYKAVSYGLGTDGRIDYDDVRRKAREHNPKMIIAGYSAYSRQIDKSVFPGTQGGPLEHVIAAKAVALKEALSPQFKDYAKQIIANARTLAADLIKSGFKIVSGGTDNHLMLVDLRAKNAELTGKAA